MLKKIFIVLLMLFSLLCTNLVYADVMIDSDGNEVEIDDTYDGSVRNEDAIGIYNQNTNQNGANNLDDEITEPGVSGNTSLNSKVTSVGDKIWTIVRYVLQIASFGFLLATGVRYMFASAEQKADIKGSLIMAVIGVVLVFGSNIVIRFIQTVLVEITKQN